jgi:RimJ/RimL family protein N-acetyltransferase
MNAPESPPIVPDRIETERLVVRAYRDTDAGAIIEAIEESRAELTAWMDWAPAMRTVDDARRFLARVRPAWEAGEDFGMGIFLRESGRYLGGTGYHRGNREIPSLEVGYWMRTSEVGRGYVREAVIALTQVGFRQLGLRRMVITCASTNDRSRRVAEACGYVLEARLRNEGRMPDGSLRDTLVFSLIDTDDAVRALLADPRTGSDREYPDTEETE